MSKAEERACQYTGYYRNQSYKDYLNGYHQAEKDLELTWEDISVIRQIIFDYNRQVRNEMTILNDEEYCQEVLKRFKEQRT